jgi:hypothetical protein
MKAQSTALARRPPSTYQERIQAILSAHRRGGLSNVQAVHHICRVVQKQRAQAAAPTPQETTR